ncbi:hypothetical protein [Gracilibacillus oryzae]|uniref:hypothetical protein n=1 Tax=Gracilibacillus oryzae TaxID=1672701 RepID=UPI001296739D|nr:hypothetical protein [Gracilibacillus oryzae]
MKQYSKNPKLTYKGSILFHYYYKFQPVSLMDSLFYNGPKKQKSENDWNPLPWRETFEIDFKHNQHFGPNSNRYVEWEFNRIIDVYQMIKRKGYRPKVNEDGYIRGYILQKEDDYRFLVTRGQHRIAALAALGLEHKKITVKIEPKRTRVINVEDVNTWPQVVNGLYDKATAIRIFESYFKNTGREKAIKMGMIKK